jgi:predicted DNA-binding protein
MKKRPFEATKITVFIPTEQKERLDLLSEGTGAPITVHVRRALDAYLAERLSTPKRKKGA